MYEIVKCAIDGMPEYLIIQIFGDEVEDMDTGVGGNSIWVDEEDLAGDDFSIRDISENPDMFVVKGDEQDGFWIEAKNGAEQSA